MRVNVDKLKGKMVEKNVTGDEMAKKLGVDKSTFYRKLKAEGLSFTIGQMHGIANALNLSNEEAVQIFLAYNSQ